LEDWVEMNFLIIGTILLWVGKEFDLRGKF
jgi:hypothetical protein